ncbi:hypothetical protein D3C80_1477640 [compost metagenome]
MPTPYPLRNFQGDGTEQSAEDATSNTAKQNQYPVHCCGRQNSARAKIGIAADQRQRGQTRKNDGHKHQPVGTGLVCPAHFLNGENDACKRRVKGGCNARCRASKNEAARLRDATPTGGLKHDGCTHLYGRTFAPDRRTAQQAGDRENDFPCGDSQV